ncbi:hypothetical protein ACQ4PT_064243 [Festuca glaucescens]
MSHLAAPASPLSSPNPMPGAGDSSPPPERARRKAVVVVMGATGAGKSRLAVDLAGHFAGVEVVSADSMQVYRGLDVLTNKVPLHEQNGVPHHLLSIIDPSVEFTCRDFRHHALPIIEDILDRGGLPVVVGGTNFYIQVHRCRFPFLEFYHSSTLVDFLILSYTYMCLRLLLAHSCLRIWQKICRVAL